MAIFRLIYSGEPDEYWDDGQRIELDAPGFWDLIIARWLREWDEGRTFAFQYSEPSPPEPE